MDETLTATSSQPPQSVRRCNHLLSIKVSGELGTTLKDYWGIPFRLVTAEEHNIRMENRALEARERGIEVRGRVAFIPVRASQECSRPRCPDSLRYRPAFQVDTIEPFDYSNVSPNNFLALMEIIGVPLGRYEIEMRQGVVTGDQLDGRPHRSNRWYLRLYFSPSAPTVEMDPRHKEIIGAILSLTYRDLFVYDNRNIGQGITYNFRSALPVNPIQWPSSASTYNELLITIVSHEELEKWYRAKLDDEVGTDEMFTAEERGGKPSIGSDRINTIEELLSPRTAKDRRHELEFSTSVEMVRRALAGNQKIVLGFSMGKGRKNRAGRLLTRAANGDFRLDDAGTKFLESVETGYPQGSYELLLEIPANTDPENFARSLGRNIGGSGIRLPRE